MCLSPRTQHLADGRTVQTACQECRQCVEQAKLDWVGRNIAESKTTRKAHAVTLTYGRDENGFEDHPRAKVLTYSDVQKWFKLLRYHGFPCRYFLSGEYGSLKGRCHWHFIVYWLDAVPNWSGFDQYGKWSDNHLSQGAHKVRFNHRRLKDGKPAFNRGEPSFWWPHGWTEVSEGASVDAIKYVCKYIQKDVKKDENQSQFMMSKQPPLGAGYFMLKAEKYVAAGLAPQGGMGYVDGRLVAGSGGYKYTFPEARTVDKTGAEKLMEFHLKGVSLEYFLAHYVATWERLRPNQPLPPSMLLDSVLDPSAWKGANDMDPDGDYRFERLCNAAEARVAARAAAIEADPMFLARERAAMRRRPAQDEYSRGLLGWYQRMWDRTDLSDLERAELWEEYDVKKR